MRIWLGIQLFQRSASYFLCIASASFTFLQAGAQKPGDLAASAASLRARIEASPLLALHGTYFPAHPPRSDWKSGSVSGIAVDNRGNIYEIQRGNQADPILELSENGKLLRSWGRGSYQLPHSIRIDPSGNVWTVDAASSTMIEYSHRGTKLLTIKVGGQPKNGSAFNGTTDIAFGPQGRLFITDGYGNARVLEYTRDGKKIREWGNSGSRPGEFHLPHAIQIDQGTIYIADRENGRIEEFDLDGDYLGEISHLGRVYSLKVDGDVLWASMGPFDQPPGSPGWIIKLSKKTGDLLGHIDLAEYGSGHALELMQAGEPIVTVGSGLLWFKAK